MRTGCSLQNKEAMRGRAVKTLNAHLQHTKLSTGIGRQEWQAPQRVGKPFTPGTVSVKKEAVLQNKQKFSIYDFQNC